MNVTTAGQRLANFPLGPEMVELGDVQGWLGMVRESLALLKQGRDLLPTGPKRDEIEAKIRQLEEAMTRSDAKLAKDLGYKLCQCTFPPQIMLWQQTREAWVCPNQDCGRAVQKPRLPQRRIFPSSW